MLFVKSNTRSDQLFGFSRTQARTVCRKSYVMNKKVKLLALKIWNSVILEYFLKEKAMKEVFSEVGIITTLSKNK